MGKVKGLLMDMEDDVYSGMTYKQFTDKWGESKAHVNIWNEHSVTKVNTDTKKTLVILRSQKYTLIWSGTISRLYQPHPMRSLVLARSISSCLILISSMLV